MSVNWSDPSAMASKYFKVGELTLLPSWGVHHLPSLEEQANLLKLAAKMDKVREILGKAIKVHCAIRPTAANCPGSPHNGENYNKAVGSVAMHSAHISGLAMDFDCGEDCNETRKRLMPYLEPLGMRMEDITGPWVHLDLAPVITNRFFKP